MTHPTPSDHGHTRSFLRLPPKQRALLPDLRRVLIVASVVSLVANVGAIFGYRYLSGHLPNSQMMFSAQIWGINPTALSMGIFALGPSVLAAVVAGMFVWSGNVRRRTYSPFHWAGLANILASGTLSLGLAITVVVIPGWSLYGALLTTIDAWALIYGGLMPAILETLQTYRNRTTGR